MKLIVNHDIFYTVYIMIFKWTSAVKMEHMYVFFTTKEGGFR